MASADRRYKSAVFGAAAVLKILFYILLAVIIFFLGRTAYIYGYSIFNEQAVEASPGTDVTVEIPEDASAREIGEILKDNGLIENVSVFVLQERLSSWHGEEQAGTYTLNTSETPDEMLEIMSGDQSDEAS